MIPLAHPHTASPTADGEPSIAIVGASITGPTLALLLRQAGLTNVTVLDASPYLHAQAGGVIGLEHAALDVLDSVGVPQHEFVPFTSERVVAVKVADRCDAGHTHTFYPGRSTAWHLINTALLQRLPEGWLRLGSRVQGLATDVDGRAQLQIADADPLSADLVVFADGRRSTGRRLLDPGRKLRYGGYVAWRGQSPTVLPDLHDYTRLELPGAGLHLFPILQRDGAVVTDWTFYLNHSEQEFRTLLDADPVRRTYVLPHQIPAQARRHITDHARQLLPSQASAIIEATPSWSAAPIVDIAPPERMIYPIGHRAHAVLLGDALAPVRPNTARGANNGIEQATSLAATLRQHLRYGADLPVALEGWQRRNLPAVYDALELGPKLGATLGLGHHPVSP
ncbi:FAD-dependent monooxygenase [Nonomuraea cavernae]|uniref:2-polyprenyl-6-methoxyphenol hydroxylase n=1 Tax=Nonomuraea cavernae TaxID=2045107 RepID=A0A917ZG75_9ACTN|nr:FAD-dependent monooxygenase [Nonomuraea cavernae]MCA2190644.1 FAD-dependent monooxygenase [Nonomuraea cavernae]GGO81257.1 2-polyprenyl-6-methoxyphenol hydroxylase [Nonomuraea cavernae]